MTVQFEINITFYAQGLGASEKKKKLYNTDAPSPCDFMLIMKI